jgi:hypothetical protein
MALCAVAIGVQAVAWVGSDQLIDKTAPLLAMVTGVAVIVYFSSALQYFLLRLPRSGVAYVALFLFGVWVLPLLAGPLVGLTLRSPETVLLITSISPIVGIGASTWSVTDLGAEAYVALAVSVLLAVLFVALRSGVERGYGAVGAPMPVAQKAPPA